MPAGAWFRRSSTPAVVTSLCRCDSRNPLTIWRNAARLAGTDPRRAGCDNRARPVARAGLVRLLACRRTGAHFVTTYHGTYNEDLPFKRRYNSVMAHGERVIAASRFIADLIAPATWHRSRADPDHSARR